jgi:hypothetical protein
METHAGIIVSTGKQKNGAKYFGWLWVSATLTENATQSTKVGAKRNGPLGTARTALSHSVRYRVGQEASRLGLVTSNVHFAKDLVFGPLGS